jgi:hypothetical protein
VANKCLSRQQEHSVIAEVAVDSSQNLDVDVMRICRDAITFDSSVTSVADPILIHHRRS